MGYPKHDERTLGIDCSKRRHLLCFTALKNTAWARVYARVPLLIKAWSKRPRPAYRKGSRHHSHLDTTAHQPLAYPLHPSRVLHFLRSLTLSRNVAELYSNFQLQDVVFATYEKRWLSSLSTVLSDHSFPGCGACVPSSCM